MSCLARNVKKFINTYSCAGLGLNTQINRRWFISVNSALHSSHKIPKLISCKHFTALWRCRHIHSDNDKNLAKFLGKEISLEEVKVSELPKIEDFGMSMQGSVVILERLHENEKVQVSFNIRDNIKVEESDDDEGSIKFLDDFNDYGEYEDSDDVEELLQGGLEEVLKQDNRHIRYPIFKVLITKKSGNTLRFNCSLNTTITENYEVSDRAHVDDDHDGNFLIFDDVQIYNSGMTKDGTERCGDVHSDAYAGRFSSRVGGRELHALLLNTLLERGIDGVFVNSLVDMASAIEHRNYIGFMKSLDKYVSE